MSVKIGVSPISWTNDDMPELGKDTTVEHCLTEGKQAGYRGFELGGKWPKDSEILRPLFDKYSMDVVSSWFCGGLLADSLEDEIERITPHMNLLKNMGTEVIVYCEMDSCVHGDISSPLSKRPILDDGQWDEWTEKLSQLAKYTLSNGMKLAYHHHMGTMVESMDEVDRLLNETDERYVSLNYDCGHFYFANEDPHTALKKYMSRTTHIHLKDVRDSVKERAYIDDLSFLKAVKLGVYTVPGDGDLDLKPIADNIHKSDYKGWVVVEAEQDPSIANPFEYAKKGYDFLTQELKF